MREAILRTKLAEFLGPTWSPKYANRRGEAQRARAPRREERCHRQDHEVGEWRYDASRDNEEAESMNEETSAGAPPRAQARGQDAAMQMETATRTDRPTRRQGESLVVVRPPDVDAVGSRVEGAQREGLTAPEVLAMALVDLLALGGLGSMMLVLGII
jgi:hypothetical protein